MRLVAKYNITFVDNSKYYSKNRHYKVIAFKINITILVQNITQIEKITVQNILLTKKLFVGIKIYYNCRVQNITPKYKK